MARDPIYVTRPYLPPLDEFIPYLERLWQSRVLTNGAAFHVQLESELAAFLGVPHVALFNNGTNALLVALQALDLSGEVITTPYTFVATTHALIWNRLDPVFVDIDPETFNMAPERIEEAITERTTAILPVHCYGNPCDTDAIARIADKHRLKVLYDAAHAFAVNDSGGSLLRHGDMAVLSFHATKVFNTFEGGAIVCHDPETKARVDLLKNFGIVNETEVLAVGSNGKMSEFNAALGLAQLKHIQKTIEARQAIDAHYRHRLSDVSGIEPLTIPSDMTANYSYFPLLVTPEFPINRDALYNLLKKQNIIARRYFYPLVSELAPYRELASSSRNNLPIATRVAEQILCLPIYPDLPFSVADEICDAIRSA